MTHYKLADWVREGTAIPHLCQYAFVSYVLHQMSPLEPANMYIKSHRASDMKSGDTRVVCKKKKKQEKKPKLHKNHATI
jgi:hypothetical protein